MIISKPNKFWTLVIILLIAIMATGSVIVWSRYSPSQPIKISTPSSQEIEGEIYIGDAVTNPGFYPLKTGDSVADIIQAAGGISSNADISQLKLYIPAIGEEHQPQKIDINRAEAWLLQALPGIGEIRAQAIVDYRRQNGPFNNINELIKVKGIGVTTYEKIKSLITVAD
jgi:competence protein ComEA